MRALPYGVPFGLPYSKFFERYNARGGSGLPSLAELIAYYKGRTGDIGDDSYLLPQPPGYTTTPQVLGTSAAFDGSTGYGTLSEAVTVSGDFRIAQRVVPSLSSTQTLLSGNLVSYGYLTITSGGDVYVRVGGTEHSFLSPKITTSESLLEVVRSGDQLWVEVDGVAATAETCSLVDLNLSIVGAYLAGLTLKYSGNLYDLKITDSTGTLLDLAMICKGSTTEYSATPGLPDCVWTGGVTYVEHDDGTGSNRANEDGYGTDGSIRYPLNHASATTNYPGPIAASCQFQGISCLSGDGTNYVTLDSAITLSGAFKIEWTSIVTASSRLLGNSGTWDDHVVLDYTNDRVGLWANSTSYDIDLDTETVSETHKYKIVRDASNLTTLYVDDVAQSNTHTIPNDISFTWLIKANIGLFFGQLHYLKIYNASDTLIHHYSFEDHAPGSSETSVRDHVGGNDGTISGGTLWGSRDEGTSHRLNGYTISGAAYLLTNPNTNLLQDGSTPDYLKDKWTTTLNSGLSVLPSVGPESAYVLGTYPIDFDTYPAMDAGELSFMGSDGWAVYKDSTPVLGVELWDNTPSTPGTGWTQDGGTFTCDGTQTASTYVLDAILEDGETYYISYVIESVTAGLVKIICSGDAGSYKSSPGPYTETLTASGGTNVGLQGDADFVGSIDNISVRKYDSTQTGQSDNIVAIDKVVDCLGDEEVGDPDTFKSFTAPGQNLDISFTQGVPTVGDNYFFVFTVSDYVAGTLEVGVGDYTSYLTSMNGNGIYKYALPATGVSDVLRFRSATAGATYTISNISVKQITRD